MAKVILRGPIAGLRGSVGSLIFKTRGTTTFVSAYPDMSRVKPSAAQRSNRERLTWANAFYRCLNNYPELLARYQRRAEAAETTVHRLATKDYMGRAKAAGKLNIVADLLEELSAKPTATRKARKRARTA
jgi:DNA polymerase III alpha subunit